MIRFGEKPYHSLDYYYKQTYNEKIYKVAINGGFSCPNRDGTLSHKGCVFCNAKGSGSFTGNSNDWQGLIEDDNSSLNDSYNILKQIDQGINRLSNKIQNGRYIAYFQSFTNTYDTVEGLRKRFDIALSHPSIIGLSIGTRPDCLNEDIVTLLASYNMTYDITVELGLQSIHQASADVINRCYTLDVYDKAVEALKSRGIKVVTHMIIGLPGETSEMILETAKYIANTKTHGIKFHLLHVLRGTLLYNMYNDKVFDTLSIEAYIALLINCIEYLPESMVVHRLTGDGSKDELVAPLWSANKRHVLNQIHKTFKELGTYQSRLYK